MIENLKVKNRLTRQHIQEYRKSFALNRNAAGFSKEMKEFVFTLFSNGLNVLVVAQGNSLRTIVKELDKINDKDIINLNIVTGKIYLYRFDTDLKIISKKIL